MNDESDLTRLVKERDRALALVSELTERFDEKIEELSLVRQLGDALGSSLDQRTICKRTVDLLQVALAPENCSLMLLDQHGEYLVLAAARGAYDESAMVNEPGAEPIMFELGEGVAGTVALAQTPMRLEDIEQSDVFLDRDGDPVQPKSLLCLPLLSRGQCLGVINLSDSISNAFEPRHERILAIIANAVAMALENARLFYEVTKSSENLAYENQSLRRQLNDQFDTDGMVGDSPRFRAALKLVSKVADTTANVLITGDSGTGKELFARALHANSSRKDKPFIAINCAALPETLLEAELFGIEKGVATGVEPRPGTFELAHGGTLFLDELGDMSAAVQVRLLRVLQERKVSRVGAAETTDVDVRVVAATHRHLNAEIDAGRFREDLYYRIRVVEIQLPSLKDRREDILPLARHFLARFVAKHGRHQTGLTRGAARALLEHQWPGNVRELEHVVEQAVLLADADEVDSEDLGLQLGNSAGIRVDIPDDSMDFHEVVEEVNHLAESLLIRRALLECRGNRTRAADRLGISRRSLLYKLQKYGIGE